MNANMQMNMNLDMNHDKQNQDVNINFSPDINLEQDKHPIQKVNDQVEVKLTEEDVFSGREVKDTLGDNDSMMSIEDVSVGLPMDKL
jgi:hypothetical protein